MAMDGGPIQPQRSRRSQLSTGGLSLVQSVNEADERDAESRYREEAVANRIPTPANDANQFSSDSSTDGDTIIVAWDDNDPENPYNWSTARKTYILVVSSFIMVNSTLSSSLPSNAIPYMSREWHVESAQQQILPITIFLIGYVFGPILWAPLCEQVGRRAITILTFCTVGIWNLACGFAPSFPAFLIFRFLAGIFASSPIAVIPGIFADIFGEARTRGRAMALIMATTTFGPLLGPIISGYTATSIGWRWTFWIAVMYAGFWLVPMLFIPETYGPILLKRRAAKLRRAARESVKNDAHPDAQTPAVPNYMAPNELEKTSVRDLITIVLTRPVRMLFFELIVSTTCMYLSMCYAIFYMCFQAFPLIFQGVYGMTPGECGLIFLSIGVGSVLSLPLFYLWDNHLRKAQAKDAPWTRREELKRLPLALLGGPLFVISLFWLGWSAKEEIHWAAPMMAGIPFGLGFMLIFSAMINYLTDAYEIFAASANAAASCSRSALAVVLPLASPPLFGNLGIAGGCSLLGGLCLILAFVPLLFIWKGERIRAGSKFCIALKKRKEEMALKVEEQRAKREAVEARLAQGRESHNGVLEKKGDAVPVGSGGQVKETV